MVSHLQGKLRHASSSKGLSSSADFELIEVQGLPRRGWAGGPVVGVAEAVLWGVPWGAAAGVPAPAIPAAGVAEPWAAGEGG